MEPNNFSNLNTQNIHTPRKHSPFKIFFIIIVLAGIILGALYLKKISDKEKEAKMLMEIREKALNALNSETDPGPVDTNMVEASLKLLSGKDDIGTDTKLPLDPDLINLRENSLKSLSE